MNLAAITLIGIAANFPNPGIFQQVNFAAGPSAGSTTTYSALSIGNKSTAGSAVVNTVYGPDTSPPVQDEADVIQFFGTGSQQHRFFLRFTAVNKTTALYFICVTESTGAAATGTLTFVGAATATCNCRVWCGSDFVDFTINSGDSVTTIAANCAAAVNTQTRWAIVATSSVGVVTTTAVNKGPEGNWIKIGAVLTQNASATTAVSPNAPTALTGGTTSDVNTSALAAIAATRFYYIGLCDSDATNIGRAVTQIESQALPATGIRQRAFVGSSDTVANDITLAIALNDPRTENVWGGTSTDWTPLELAANNMALYSLLEAQQFPRHNFSQFPTDATDAISWLIPGTRNGPTAGPSVAQVAAMLNNGITPIALLPNGQTQLVKRITTRSLNGSVNDYRVRDAHKVTICDRWTDDAKTLTANQFGGLDLIDNPPPGSVLPRGNLVWPQIWGNALEGLVEDYGANGQLQNVPDILAGMQTQRETDNPSRMSNLTPLEPVDIADQFCMVVDQVA